MEAIANLFNSQTFAGYLGRALIILAILAPLAKCEMNAEDSRKEEKLKRLELQEACIAQRGNWSSRKSSCSFNE